MFNVYRLATTMCNRWRPLDFTRLLKSALIDVLAIWGQHYKL